MSHFVTVVSDDLQEECNSFILNENIIIYRLMVHAQHVEEEGLRGSVEMLRGQHLLMEVLQMEDLRYKTRLDSRIRFLIKFLISFLSLGIIGCLTLSLKRERVLVHQPKSTLAESVVRSTMIIVLRGQIFVLAVVKAGTRLGILPM